MARILVVDDEPLIAMLAADWLVELGHEAVGPAFTLVQALEFAEASIDGALLDVKLGRDSSYAVATALAARGVPYAFVTGRSVEEIDLAYTPVAMLDKPYRFEEFRKTIDALLGAGAA